MKGRDLGAASSASPIGLRLARQGHRVDILEARTGCIGGLAGPPRLRALHLGPASITVSCTRTPAARAARRPGPRRELRWAKTGDGLLQRAASSHNMSGNRDFLRLPAADVVSNEDGGGRVWATRVAPGHPSSRRQTLTRPAHWGTNASGSPPESEVGTLHAKVGPSHHRPLKRLFGPAPPRRARSPWATSTAATRASSTARGKPEKRRDDPDLDGVQSIAVPPRAARWARRRREAPRVDEDYDQ